MTFFIASLFPHKGSKPIARTVAILCACLSSLVFPAGQVAMEVYVSFFEILSLLLCVYLIALPVIATFQRKEGAVYILSGFGLFVLAIALDVINDRGLRPAVFFFPAGLLMLMLSHSLILAKRFSKAFNEVENLAVELREKNIALTRMDRLKDEFLVNTSHELKTPLNGIIGIGEALRDGAFGTLAEKVKTNLDLMTTSGRRLLGLINDILDFSKLKHRDIRLDPVPVDIASLADTVLAVLKPLATEKALVLVNKIPSGLPAALGDEVRLGQVLYNLVGNAIKYTQFGRVTVLAEQHENMIEVSVSDTGIGIEEEKHESVFRLFEQEEGDAARQAGGTGLGLAITKSLVELHKGQIGVVSRKGQGSTFWFTLPVADKDSASRQPPTFSMVLPHTNTSMPLPIVPQKADRNNQDRIVLAVDDDPVNLQVVASHMTFLSDVRVETADSGPAALSWIEDKGAPDLVLLDIMMPGMTGYEVCRTLRSAYSARQLPVIMLTVKNRISDLTEGFASGANDYLAKPFEKDELLARVTTQLELKEAFDTYRENLRLKKEITRRKKTEFDLKITQRRLTRILDDLDETIIVYRSDHAT